MVSGLIIVSGEVNLSGYKSDLNTLLEQPEEWNKSFIQLHHFDIRNTDPRLLVEWRT